MSQGIFDTVWDSILKNDIRLTPIYLHLMDMGMTGDQIENLTLREVERILDGEGVVKSDDKGDNAPTNPSLWAQAKSKARSKFKVYPSAYANAWAAKWYKSKGGGWKKKSKKGKKK
ncbi:MAG: hypothetical protein CML17_01075 [Pusillimonas sp.]|nr:hypothetical protein [Pusillimonas sp.]